MKNINKKKAGVSLGIISGLVITMMLVYSLSTTTTLEIVPTDDGKSWHIIFEGNLAQAAEADPGAGAGGILGVYFVNHSAAYTYTANDSSTFETWATAAGLGYANADDFNLEIDHSTDFNIVVRIRGNRTMCDNPAAAHVDANLRVNLSSAGAANLDIDALTAMTPVITQNDSGCEFIWMNFNLKVDQAAGKLSIDRDQTADITAIVFSAYY